MTDHASIVAPDVPEDPDGPEDRSWPRLLRDIAISGTLAVGLVGGLHALTGWGMGWRDITVIALSGATVKVGRIARERWQHRRSADDPASEPSAHRDDRSRSDDVDPFDPCE